MRESAIIYSQIVACRHSPPVVRSDLTPERPATKELLSVLSMKAWIGWLTAIQFAPDILIGPE